MRIRPKGILAWSLCRVHVYGLYNQGRGLLSSVRYSKGCISGEKDSFQANLIHLCENSETCSLTFSTVLNSKDTTAASTNEKVISAKKSDIFSAVCIVAAFFFSSFYSLELFFILQRNTVMVPSPRMCALCVYQIPLVFTRHLAFAEKTFSNNAFCYETSFLSCTHTAVGVTSVHFQPSAVTVEGKTHLWTVISEGCKYNWLLSIAAY